MHLGIIANTSKKQVIDILPSFLAWLTEKHIDFSLPPELLTHLNLTNYQSFPSDEIADHSDFILSFGGDGTFLQTARLVAPRPVPIIGVNFGGLGYLAEVQYDELPQRIDDLLSGNYKVQTRAMLAVCTNSADRSETYYGLNDIVVDKGGHPRAIKLETELDGEYLNTFHADGLIISTPTGSTGYSLSAGGPITEPGVEGIIINPICPHMLAHRALVVQRRREISITAYSEAGSVNIVVDGQKVVTVESGRKIDICSAGYEVRIATFSDHTFFELLRNKLQWKQEFQVNKGEGL